MGHPHCDYMRPIQRLSSGSRDFWVQATKTLEIARFQENHGVSKLSKLRLCYILYEMSKLLSHRWARMLARHFQVQGYRQPPAVQQKKHVRRPKFTDVFCAVTSKSLKRGKWNWSLFKASEAQKFKKYPKKIENNENHALLMMLLQTDIASWTTSGLLWRAPKWFFGGQVNVDL